MAATITVELMVGLTERIKGGMEVACADLGMRPSQYARQAIYEKLIRGGYLERPNFKKFDSSVPQIAEPAE
jgi:hypothetical protein